jgi:hypothetical protein
MNIIKTVKFNVIYWTKSQSLNIILEIRNQDWLFGYYFQVLNVKGKSKFQLAICLLVLISSLGWLIRLFF